MDNQETNQTTGRFHIGQEIYVFAVVVDNDNPLFPGVHDITNGAAKLLFKKLTVAEHHKVPTYQNAQALHDGYILTDGQASYSNQYPKAMDGWSENSANYLFKYALHESDAEEVKKLFEKQAQKPVFWNCVSSILNGLADHKGPGRQNSEIDKAIKLINSEFEKAFPKIN